MATQTTSVTTPEWVKDAIFYQIFPDRFAKSDRVARSLNFEPWDSPPTPFSFTCLCPIGDPAEQGGVLEHPCPQTGQAFV